MSRNEDSYNIIVTVIISCCTSLDLSNVFFGRARVPGGGYELGHGTSLADKSLASFLNLFFVL